MSEAGQPVGEARRSGLCLTCDGRAMPPLHHCQDLHERDSGIGFQPANCHAGSREDWKKRGEMIWLEHGVGRDYPLEVEALVGFETLDAAARSIDARD